MIEIKHRPLLGITIGDPSGIGPEIILKALDEEGIYEICKPVVLGPEEVLTRAGKVIGKESLNIHKIENPKDGIYEKGTIDIIEPGKYDLETLVWGKEQDLMYCQLYRNLSKGLSIGSLRFKGYSASGTVDQ